MNDEDVKEVNGKMYEFWQSGGLLELYWKTEPIINSYKKAMENKKG